MMTRTELYGFLDDVISAREACDDLEYDSAMSEEFGSLEDFAQRASEALDDLAEEIRRVIG